MELEQDLTNSNNLPQEEPQQINIVTHNQKGMRWYLFMVWGLMIFYFVVIASSVLNNISQLGSYYKFMTNWGGVYYTYMFAVVVITVICECILAFLTLRSRNDLLNFKSRGIKGLFICLIVPIIFVFILFIGTALMIESEEAGAGMEMIAAIFSAKYIFTYGGWKVYLYIGAYIGFIVGNAKYFKNRKHLFVN